MSSRKVLIITYYWPPSGGSGVQRWLKFVKYLPSYGVVPYVFTPENPAFDVRDDSLLKDVPDEAEVFRFPIWEPYDAFFAVAKWFGMKRSTKPTQLVSTQKRSMFQKLSTWMRGNLIIPDPRVFWVAPSVKFLNDFLKDNQIETVITTGPPHSMHLIGLRLKAKNPSLKWIADFRDPWSEWGFLDSLMVGPVARRLHRYLERKVLTIADAVTTITPFYVRHFQKLSGRQVALLTNGYDEDDFTTLAPVRTTKFVMRHVGIVNEKCNPRPFMEAVAACIREDASFFDNVRIDFVGEVHPDFKAYIIANPELFAITTFTPPVPHKDLIPMYNESSVLLLILTGYKDAEGYMPGKLFEYLATGLPILGTGPEHGDAANLMNASGQGIMIDGSNTSAINNHIMTMFYHWKENLQGKSTTKQDMYSRKRLTQQLITIIESL